MDTGDGKCPKCGEMTLWRGDFNFNGKPGEIWCLNDDCDYETMECVNEGKCLVVLNFGNVSVMTYTEPYCNCQQEYEEIENQATEDVDALIEKTFPECKWSTWYHPTWWEAEGLAENPLK